MPQETLFPVEDEPQFATFDVSEIEGLVPDAADCPIEPEPRMIESIRRYGILEPILLIKKKTGKKFDLAAGRRRIRAALLTEKKYIPARIFPYGWTKRSVLALVENEVRRKNPVVEWRSFNELLTGGMNEEAIVEQTGMATSQLKKLIAINRLPQQFQDAFDAGKLRPSLVTLLAMQRPEVQKELAAQFDDGGKLTINDVIEVRRRVKKAAVANLPPSLFEVNEQHWKQIALDTLDSLLSRLSDAPAEVREWVKNLSGIIEQHEVSGGDGAEAKLQDV